MKKENKIINITCLLLATIIWGAAFVSQKIGGGILGAYTFGCIRFFIGALVLVPFILIGSKRKNRDISGERDISDKKKNDRNKLWLAGILCGVALAFASNFQQLALNFGATVGKAGFLTTCYIVMVPVISIFIKVKIKPLEIVGVLIALVGLFIMFIKDESFVLEKADIFLLLSALCFAIQILLINHFAPDLEVLQFSSAQFLVCALATMPFMLIFDMKDMALWLSGLTSSQAILALLYAGILSSGIAYTLQIRGQKNFSPAVASLIMSLEAVFSMIFGVLMFREKLSMREYVGCVIIFAAVIIAQLNIKKR